MVATAAVRSAPVAFATGMAAVLVPGGVSLMLAAGPSSTARHWAWSGLAVLPLLVPALAAGLLATLAGLALRGHREMARNYHGLCPGSRGRAATDNDPRRWQSYLDDAEGLIGGSGVDRHGSDGVRPAAERLVPHGDGKEGGPTVLPYQYGFPR